jgi:YfiH family protein
MGLHDPLPIGLSPLEVVWPAPASVQALMSTRGGGVSLPPYESLNLGLHVGDDPLAVTLNRQRFAELLKGSVAWLQQVHGCEVVYAPDVLAGRVSPEADAVWTDQPGQVCAVMVADCLPVLWCGVDGQVVGASHAGWRGLAAGVLENTAAALCRAAGVQARTLHAWLGPCIGPDRFEVGDEVRDAFGPQGRPWFRAHRRQDGSAAWLCDLASLARQRLAQCGVTSVFGGQWCTVNSADAFFSFRRDGRTGRMVAGVIRRY